ncbi:MAG: thioredoxin family protein [Aliishimia sp.]
MAATVPSVCEFDWPAPDFMLPATDGQTYTLADIAGAHGTLVMFICNHCPYVLAVLERLNRDALMLQDLGVGIAAICSNDPITYPADNFDNMTKFSKQHGLPFVYLHDVDQQVARAYDAVCTPDFFGFNADLGLQYRGRLDAARLEPAPGDMPRDLLDAMRVIAQTGKGPQHQVPSMGCSIKWA